MIRSRQADRHMMTNWAGEPAGQRNTTQTRSTSTGSSAVALAIYVEEVMCTTSGDHVEMDLVVFGKDGADG